MALGEEENVSTILILDDEPAIRRLLRLTLDPLGHVVLEAASAEEAFRRFEEADAGLNLLIADVQLPNGPSGVRVALELRSLIPILRVVLMSGFPPSLWDGQDAAEWSEIPSDSVVNLRKPFHAEEILQAVYRLIGLPMVMSAIA
jgi:CheY-like chemotaxis protein